MSMRERAIGQPKADMALRRCQVEPRSMKAQTSTAGAWWNLRRSTQRAIREMSEGLSWHEV